VFSLNLINSIDTLYIIPQSSPSRQIFTAAQKLLHLSDGHNEKLGNVSAPAQLLENIGNLDIIEILRERREEKGDGPSESW
jgi:hypothetical protein